MNNQKFKHRILIISGPTAVGKTSLACELAEELGAEIISADAFQIYTELNLGTAKPSREERARVAHHLLDIISFDQPFNAAEFSARALVAIRDISSRGKIPMLVGGTYLYLRALLEGFFPAPAADSAVRDRLLETSKKQGNEALHQKLQLVDPVAAKAIHANDTLRLTRALEVYEITGKPISEHWKKGQTAPKPLSGFDITAIACLRPRQKLYDLADQRVDRMMEAGLLAEVKSLCEKGFNETMQSSFALGYRHLLPVARGKGDLGKAVETFKRDTRHFIKRQLTWLKNEFNFTPVNLDKTTSHQVLELLA